MLLVAHWMRPSWPAIRSVRIQGRFDGRLARSTSQLLLMPPAEARMKASDFRMVSTDEITSRCASALCRATVVNSAVACAIFGSSDDAEIGKEAAYIFSDCGVDVPVFATDAWSASCNGAIPKAIP